MNAIRREHPAIGEMIPDLPRIVGLRNVLVHQYDLVPGGTLERLIHEKLPSLIELLEALLEQAEPPGGA